MSYDAISSLDYSLNHHASFPKISNITLITIWLQLLIYELKAIFEVCKLHPSWGGEKKILDPCFKVYKQFLNTHSAILNIINTRP